MIGRLDYNVQKFGAGGSFAQSRTPMTLDQIRSAAPSVFAESKHVSRTSRFTYIPTSRIVERLMEDDYGVFSVMQGGSKDYEKRGYTKHLVRFRQLSQPTQVGGTFGEIILMNAHDGTSSYRLMAGVHRLVCSNGMTVDEGLISDYRIKHTGAILLEVSQSVGELSGRLPMIGASIGAMQSINLSLEERADFARSSIVAKYGEEPAPVSVDQVLQPRRQEDYGQDLWTTFNVVQEALIEGGQRYRIRTKNDRVQRRTTQAVRSVDGTTNLNRALWKLAEDVRHAKVKA